MDGVERTTVFTAFIWVTSTSLLKFYSILYICPILWIIFFIIFSLKRINWELYHITQTKQSYFNPSLLLANHIIDISFILNPQFCSHLHFFGYCLPLNIIPCDFQLIFIHLWSHIVLHNTLLTLNYTFTSSKQLMQVAICLLYSIYNHLKVNPLLCFSLSATCFLLLYT